MARKTNEELQSEDVTTQAPKAPRLSAVERLAAQLAEAQAKAKELAKAQLVKAQAELDKAKAGTERARIRQDKAQMLVNQYRDMVEPVSEANDAQSYAEALDSESVAV